MAFAAPPDSTWLYTLLILLRSYALEAHPETPIGFFTVFDPFTRTFALNFTQDGSRSR